MIVIPKLKKVLLFNTPYMIFFLAVWRIHNLYLILPYPSWLVGLISTVILKIAVYLKSKMQKNIAKILNMVQLVGVLIVNLKNYMIPLIPFVKLQIYLLILLKMN